MTKLRRILLKGIDSDKKLNIVSRCARMLVELGKRDPRVRDLAIKVTNQCKGKDYLCEAKVLHAYVRDKIRYVKDIASVERFATPQRTLFLEKAGDCDDSSIALSALLESIGHETRLIFVDPDFSGKFTHVIAQVKLGDKWYWMETTRKVPFGWSPKFTISHIIDKKSIGERDMQNLDNLFGLEDIGLGRSRASRSSSSSRRSFSASRSRISAAVNRIRSSASRAVSRAASIHSQAVKRTTGSTRARLSRIAQNAQRIRQSIAGKASQAKSAAYGRFKQRAGSLKSAVIKRRDSILNRYKKGLIAKPKAREQMLKLKAKADLASKKLQDEKVKAIAPIIAFEAKKEEEIADKQAELEKEIVEKAPAEEVLPEVREEPGEEPAQEEPDEYQPEAEAFEEPERDEESFEEPEAEENESEPGTEEFETEEEGMEGLGAAKKKRRREILLAARAKPKGTVWDRIIGAGTKLGLVGIAAWAGVNLIGKIIERRK